MLGSPVDTRGRLKRYVVRPRGRLIYVRKNPKLLELLAFIHRHGPLPTNYLFTFYGSESQSEKQEYGLKKFRAYLRRLVDGCCADYAKHGIEGHECVAIQRYLCRPTDYRTANAHYDQVVYDLTEEGEQLLRDHDLFCEFFTRRDHSVHRLMAACISASIELVCKGKYTYYSQPRVLAKKGNPLALDYLEPDVLFAVEANGAQRYFAVEVDRGTEQRTETKRVRLSETKRRTIEQKLRSYETFFERQDYKRVWDIRNCRLLFATTVDPKSIKQLVREKFPALLNRVYFAQCPHFEGTDWTIPPVYEGVLQGWENAAGEHFSLIKTGDNP